jgi:hypothetical protein
MYLDAVLDGDMQPLFNGTTEEVVDWLTTEDLPEPGDVVAIGSTSEIVSVSEYLDRYNPGN